MADDLVLVTLDGKAHDTGEPLLHVDDLGLLRGDGIFETILVRAGKACTVELHLGRLRRSAEALELPVPDLDEWRLAIGEALERWGSEREGMLRLVCSRGRESALAKDGVGSPTGYVLLGPLPERVHQVREDGVSVLTLPRGHSTELAAEAPWQLLGAKTLSYATNMAAVRYAQQKGHDDAIFTSSEGRVLEATRATVVIARGDKLITPPHRHGVMPGTTQRALFEVAEKAGFTCEYAPLFGADLILADGMWLLSSLNLAARVRVLDELELAEPELHTRITELVDQAVTTIGTLAK